MAYITIRAIPGNTSKKGEVVSNRDDAVFGLKARLPRVLRIEITNTTADSVAHFLGRLKGFLFYSVVTENALRWRVKMEVDPVLIAATGIDTTFKQSLKDYILDDPHDGNWIATLQSQSTSDITVNIDKGQTYNLTQIQEDVDAFFKDRLEEQTGFQRYFFSDAIVDPRVTQGLIDEAAAEDGDGNLPENWVHGTFTSVQAIANITDRLV
jgi:hypothetical protein